MANELAQENMMPSTGGDKLLGLGRDWVIATSLNPGLKGRFPQQAIGLAGWKPQPSTGGEMTSLPREMDS